MRTPIYDWLSLIIFVGSSAFFAGVIVGHFGWLAP